MKFLKTLALVVAMSACLAFAGTGVASATNTVLCPTTLGDCSGEYFTAGTVIHAELATGHVTVHAGFATFTCAKSTLEGKLATSTTPSISITSLSFSECNGTVDVLKKGTLQIHHVGAHTGTVTSEGTEVTYSISSTSCTYGTPTARDFGILTGGSPASLKLEASLTKVAGGFLCANPASWTGHYKITKPNSLYVSTELF
jgi:hypothetical protein